MPALPDAGLDDVALLTWSQPSEKKKIRLSGARDDPSETFRPTLKMSNCAAACEKFHTGATQYRSIVELGIAATDEAADPELFARRNWHTYDAFTSNPYPVTLICTPPFAGKVVGVKLVHVS